jgi:hypothetical protein
MFSQPASEARMSNKSYCLEAALGVTKITMVKNTTFVTLCCANLFGFGVQLKSDLSRKQSVARGRCVRQKFLLSCGFKCDRIQNCQ